MLALPEERARDSQISQKALSKRTTGLIRKYEACIRQIAPAQRRASTVDTRRLRIRRGLRAASDSLVQLLVRIGRH